MKKKTLFILVIVMLLFSFVGLTACNLISSGVDGLLGGNKTEESLTDSTQNNSNKLEEGNQNNSNNSQTDQDTQQVINPLSKISVEGKTYVFQTAHLDFAKIWYPNNGGEINEADVATYMPTEEEMQEYINYIASEYKGVKLSFKQNNKLEMIFADSRDTQEYVYLQDGVNIKIDGIEGDEGFAFEITALKSLEMEIILFADNKIPIVVYANLIFRLYY